MKGYKYTLLFLLIISNLIVIGQEPIPYRKDTLWGFCNEKKEILIPCKYTKVGRFYDDSITYACIDDSCGLINIKGENINNLIYSRIIKYYWGYYTFKNKNAGILDLKGNTILEPKFDKVYYINDKFQTEHREVSDSIKDNDNYYIKNNEVFYLSNNDTLKVYSTYKEVPFDSAYYDFDTGETFYSVSKKSSGEMFVNGYNFNEGIYALHKNTYSITGKLINTQLEPLYKSGIRYNNDLMYLNLFSDEFKAIKKGNKWGFVDKNDSVIIPYKYSEVREFYANRFWVKNDSAWALLDRNGNNITPFLYADVSYFKEGLAFVKKNYKWGFIDTLGNVVIDFKYHNAFEFSEGLAQVCTSDTACGFINKKGDVIIPFNYRFNYTIFKEGLAEISKNINGRNYSGVINKKGGIIVPIKYQTTSDFNVYDKGLIKLQVYTKNNAFYIDRKKSFYADKKGNLYFE